MVRKAAKLAVYTEITINEKNHHVLLTILLEIPVGDRWRFPRNNVPHIYQKLSLKLFKHRSCLSQFIRLTPKSIKAVNTYATNIVIHTTWDRGMRNWNGDTLLSGFRTTRLVPLVINGLGKSTTLDREGVIWKGARARSAF